MNVQELEGDALHEALAIALGWVTFPDDVEGCHYWYKDAQKAPFCETIPKRDWRPTLLQTQGGALIDEYKIETMYLCNTDTWVAHIEHYDGDTKVNSVRMHGKSRLVAAMRALVVHLNYLKGSA